MSTTRIREDNHVTGYDMWAQGFTLLDHLKYLPEDGEGLDLLVVIKRVGEIVPHTTASGRVTTRRELELVDHTKSTVCATLWSQGDPHERGVIIAVKDAKKVSLPRINHLRPDQPRLRKAKTELIPTNQNRSPKPQTARQD